MLSFIDDTLHNIMRKYKQKKLLIKNIKMNVVEHKDKLEYTYKIKKGISYIHGGKQVLKDLDYPEQLFV